VARQEQDFSKVEIRTTRLTDGLYVLQGSGGNMTASVGADGVLLVDTGANASFAQGGATVKLTPKDGGTLLSYTVEAQIGGKLAQLGQRLINGAAKKLADDFFQKFATTVSPTPG
jgi:carbon monoxide dehydrogenase subunit G